MTALLDNIDPDGLLEYSVVFTDRSLNHMSQTFQQVMRDISGMLKEVYNAESTAIVPGGGTYAMEAVARQFGTNAHALIVRNGWFSYRWSQIFDMGKFTAETTVCMARQTGNGAQSPFAPAPIEEVTAKIREAKPDAVFAPHVETSAGIILPDDYIRAMAEAAHEVGARRPSYVPSASTLAKCIALHSRASGTTRAVVAAAYVAKVSRAHASNWGAASPAW